MITKEQKKAAIDTIADANGGVAEPDLILKAAKNPRHILHECFTWDNNIAGHKYRLDEARDLISSIHVFIEHEEKTVTSISYCRDPRMPGNKQGYVKVSDLARRRDEAQQALLAECDRIVSAVQRARGLALGLNCEMYFEVILANALKAKEVAESKTKKRAA